MQNFYNNIKIICLTFYYKQIRINSIRVKIIKRKFKAVTGYSWEQLIDAITSSALFCLFIRFVLFLLNIKLYFLYNILLSIIFIIISLKYQVIYYIRESLANIIEKTMGERVKCNDDIGDPYYQHDSFYNRKWFDKQKIERIDLGLTYIKDPNYNYDYIEPTETTMNILIREFLISLIQLRLLIRQIPVLFNIIKFILYCYFIFNQLRSITFIISLMIIISRIVFHLTDFTNKEILESYEAIYLMQWVRALQPVNEIGKINRNALSSLILATRNNARVMYIWAIRSILTDRRKNLYKIFPYADKLTLFHNRGYLSVNHILENLNYLPFNQSLYEYEHLDLKQENNHKEKLRIIIAIIILLLLGFTPFPKNGQKNAIGLMEQALDFVLNPLATKKIAKMVTKNENVNKQVHEHPSLVFMNKEQTTLGLAYISTPKPKKNFPELYQQEIIQKQTGQSYAVTGVLRVITKEDDPEIFEKIQKEITEQKNHEIYTMKIKDFVFAECSFKELENPKKLLTASPVVQFPISTLHASLNRFTNVSNAEKRKILLVNKEHFELLLNIKGLLPGSLHYFKEHANNQIQYISEYEFDDNKPNYECENIRNFLKLHKALQRFPSRFLLKTYHETAIDCGVMQPGQELFGMPNSIYVTHTSQNAKLLNENSPAMLNYIEKKARQKDRSDQFPSKSISPTDTFNNMKKLPNKHLGVNKNLTDE